ncbi:MAG: hypothetical protein M9890_14940 [Thermomicrobiales bacterium]|nr:hypothetical protein [Thermomicrobiales bacterium]
MRTDSSDVGAAARTTGDGATERAQSGEDVRRRGWFWHWNTVVTQYAPLIGLKGVGLINSYTVWTDRREESPHRGYAFPSQQSEADFYGEDRAELMTINKILVALDLIEIRKEMILRTDAKGRRWRVPHNLYRVKDRDDGVNLRAADVMAVARLADADTAVYRYTRRVYSPKFAPIDRNNVWHAILEELASDPLWQQLQERTRELEERASARTRAGHRKRSKTQGASASTPVELTIGQYEADVLSSGEQDGVADGSGPTSVAVTNRGQQMISSPAVGHTNTGSTPEAAEANTGSAAKSPSSAGLSSDGQSTDVAAANTTYDQNQITTTTTTTSRAEHAGEIARMPDVPSAATRGDQAQTAIPANSELTETRATGNASTVKNAMTAQQQPIEAEEDNRDGRTGSALMGHARAADPIEDTPGGPVESRSTGSVATSSPPTERRAAGAATERGAGPVVDPCPLVVSIFEAANDRRSTPLERIMLAELERDADPPARAAGSTGSDWLVAALREAVAAGSAFVAPKRIREIVQRWAADGDGPRGPGSADDASLAALSGVTASASTSESTPPDVRLPGGARGARTWASVLADLSGVLSGETFELLFAGSFIRRYWRGMVEVEVASDAVVGKLSAEYRPLVERLLNARLSKPVAVSFHITEAASSDPTPQEESIPPALRVSQSDVDLGRQVWHVVLTDLAAAASPGEIERLAGVVPIGQDAAEFMLLASPSPVARRLLEGRLRQPVERSLSALLGRAVRIRCVGRDEWAIDDGHSGE